jgi:hypothetical protein
VELRMFGMCFLRVSYELKKSAAPGADPKAATPNPEYIPRNPPDFMKPWGDCGS